MTKKLLIWIESGADGRYGLCTQAGELPFLVVGDGDTIEEAKADFMAVYNAYRDEYYRRKGEMVEAEFEFRLDASALLQQVKPYISFVGLAEMTGISRQRLSQYACGYRCPKPAMRQRILDGIHAVGAKMMAVGVSE